MLSHYVSCISLSTPYRILDLHKLGTGQAKRDKEDERSSQHL